MNNESRDEHRIKVMEAALNQIRHIAVAQYPVSIGNHYWWAQVDRIAIEALEPILFSTAISATAGATTPTFCERRIMSAQIPEDLQALYRVAVNYSAMDGRLLDKETAKNYKRLIERIATLEAHIRKLQEAVAAVLPFDRSYAHTDRRKAFDQLREAIAEPKEESEDRKTPVKSV